MPRKKKHTIRRAYNKAEWLERHIKKQNAKKAKTRKAHSLKLMQSYKGEYPCSTCFHGQVKSCTDCLPNGCEYHFNLETETYFQGKVA